MKEAKTLMDRLSKTLGKEENVDVLQEVCEWLEHSEPVDSAKMASSSSAALTEANVEARDFRLDFAHETLQSFKRDHSRSPRRALLDAKDDIIKSLTATIRERDATIFRLQLGEAKKDSDIRVLEHSNESKQAIIDFMRSLR